MSKYTHRPLWARLFAFLLAVTVFLTNVLYPWISILPAPPPVRAQESPPIETSYSAQTPVPIPLDPLDTLETLISPTQSAEILTPEITPESTSSATPTPQPEASPEDPISTPQSEAQTPSEVPPWRDVVEPTPSPSPLQPPTELEVSPSTPLPLLLSPFNINLSYPFRDTYPISYGFGEYSANVYVRLMQARFGVTSHDGIDFAMPEGTEVSAADSGKVIFAQKGTYGQTIIIKHAWGNSYYGHLSAIFVTPGQRLKTGELIGLSGNTGVSTAPHLHFGIRPSHYNPYNGYHGLIDPTPYLQGQVKGISTQSHDLIHLTKTALSPQELSLPVYLTATSAAGLRFRLTNPKGESSFIYPTIYNYGTGDTAIINRPTPFIPGTYTLQVTSLDQLIDVTHFSWGVLALNPNASLYQTGSSATIALAVLDEKGEMVCDANLELFVTTPSNDTFTLKTADKSIKLNQDICISKDLTLSPDYVTHLHDLIEGSYQLTLTASFKDQTYTISDSFLVQNKPPYQLSRLAPTRIYPLHEYPVIFRLTPEAAIHTNLSESVPQSFQTKTLDSQAIRSWIPGIEDSAIIVESDQLRWDLDLSPDHIYYFGYSFDAPDDSPMLYELGPATLGDWQENRSWTIAVDATTPVVGFFSPPLTWTNVADNTITLTYPDPRANDLMIAAIAVRPSTVTINTPTDWTLLDSRTGTDGAGEGADTGSVALYWFYKKATGSEGLGTLDFTKTGTASVIEGQIMQVRSATGEYDLAAGGYSLNGDVTSWNGTLDTNIGLLEGDLVLLSAAQNGDSSNTSAWAIAATGITATSTTNNEHGEFTTTTGNDLEIGLASQQIWEGSNTATPTVTLTQSAAVSGVVTAIRIRQGSGTRRTDAWVRSAGRQVAGTTSVAVGYPEHEPGDLLILYVGSRISTDATPTTPVGWISLGSYSGGAGSFAVDSGTARITAFYRTAETRFTGTQAVALTSGNTMIGQMISVHRDDPGGWDLAADGGGDNSAGTSWSVAGSGLSLSSSNGGDLVLVGSSINTDPYTYSSHALSASGITFGDVTQTSEFRTTNGNDMALILATGRVTDGSGSSAPTFTMTSSGSTANAPAGASFFIKINAQAQTTPNTAVGFFSPERLWTSSTSSTLNLVQPDPRSGDLMIATIGIRPSTATVDTPTGWTLLDSRTGTDSAAEGENTGSVGMYTFYKVASGSEGTATQQFTETGSVSVWMGSIMQVRSETGAYSLGAAGYSLNGDATNWNGTLDSDPGFTQGDLVILWAVQNGNPSNTSAWDLQASGLDQKSTTNEHGEFATTNGFNIEIDLANTLIWEGTNTTTPNVILTQSAAVSGAVAAIRIRQGSGTARTDTWVRSAGVQVVGTTSVIVPYPDHNIGDLIVLMVGSRSSGDDIPDTPYGWTSLGTYNGGAGSFGIDAGNSRITAFYREAEIRRWGTQTVSISSGNTAIGQMVSVHKDNVNTWTTDSDGGSDDSAGTSWSVTGTGIDLSSATGGDIILVGSSINTDGRLFSSHDLSASGITFGEVTQTAEYRSTTGNDMDLVVSTGRVIGGSGSNVAPTFTMTSNGSATNNPAGSSIFIKIIGASAGATITVGGTADSNNGETVKIAINNEVMVSTGTINAGSWSIVDVPEPNLKNPRPYGRGVN